MDITEFTAACAKRFCPECGMAITRNKKGRPRSFCSDRCRWAFDKRRERQKVKEEPKNENTRTENAAGIGVEAGCV